MSKNTLEKEPDNIREALDEEYDDSGEGKKGEILSWIKVIGISVLIAFILRNHVIVNAQVPSGSMENTIAIGDRLIGLRTAYWFSEPKRGDIVIFNYPVDEARGQKTKYIKRIIGMPGETVEIKNAAVYIDGEVLQEDYLKEQWTERCDGYTFAVPEGCYLMLGDNRNGSEDARQWPQCALDLGVATEENAMSFSYVKREAIIAKAWFRYWPLKSVGLM